MSTTVIVNDYVNGRRAHLVYSSSDIEVMAQFWHDSDRLLNDLQDHRLFAGRTRWCDLDPLHFRLLLIQNMIAADTLDDERLSDDDEPVVRSLNFLFMALAYCIAQRVGGEIEMMRVNRLTESDITYEVTAALLQLDIEDEDDLVQPSGTATEDSTPQVATFGPGFRVIVDNTGPAPR